MAKKDDFVSSGVSRSLGWLVAGVYCVYVCVCVLCCLCLNKTEGRG